MSIKVKIWISAPVVATGAFLWGEIQTLYYCLFINFDD